MAEPGGKGWGIGGHKTGLTGPPQSYRALGGLTAAAIDGRRSRLAPREAKTPPIRPYSRLPRGRICNHTTSAVALKWGGDVPFRMTPGACRAETCAIRRVIRHLMDPRARGRLERWRPDWRERLAVVNIVSSQFMMPSAETVSRRREFDLRRTLHDSE